MNQRQKVTKHFFEPVVIENDCFYANTILSIPYAVREIQCTYGILYARGLVETTEVYDALFTGPYRVCSNLYDNDSSENSVCILYAYDSGNTDFDHPERVTKFSKVFNVPTYINGTYRFVVSDMLNRLIKYRDIYPNFSVTEMQLSLCLEFIQA